MNAIKCKLTVYFEDPFWIGVFERIDKGKLTVARVVFGNEPKDYEVLRFVLRNYNSLQFSPAVAVTYKQLKKNPKRLLKEAKKQLQNQGIGTKSQQALKLQQEQRKQLCQIQKQVQKKQAANYKFALKQQKKKMKHKGH